MKAKYVLRSKLVEIFLVNIMYNFIFLNNQNSSYVNRMTFFAQSCFLLNRCCRRIGNLVKKCVVCKLVTFSL
jgi:hypothetical protein